MTAFLTGTLLRECMYCHASLPSVPCCAEMHGKTSHGICPDCVPFAELAFGVTLQHGTPRSEHAERPGVGRVADVRGRAALLSQHGTGRACVPLELARTVEHTASAQARSEPGSMLPDGIAPSEGTETGRKTASTESELYAENSFLAAGRAVRNVGGLVQRTAEEGALGLRPLQNSFGRVPDSTLRRDPSCMSSGGEPLVNLLTKPETTTKTLISRQLPRQCSKRTTSSPALDTSIAKLRWPQSNLASGGGAEASTLKTCNSTKAESEMHAGSTPATSTNLNSGADEAREQVAHSER